MAKKFQVTVPTPCKENWSKMTSNKDGRFCLSCQKTVVDFSTMSDEHILSYISKGRDTMCGRFKENQLNRELIGTTKPKFPWLRYALQVAFPAFLVSSKSEASGKAVAPIEVVSSTANPMIQGTVPRITEEKAGDTIIVKGKVTDYNGQGISFATVMIKGTPRGVLTDSSGVFEIKVEKGEDVLLVASAVGYSSSEMPIQLGNEQKLNIKLDQSMQLEMDHAVAGMMMPAIVHRDSPLEIIKAICKIDSMKVYPNPASGGSNIMLWVRVKDPGEYSIELIKGDGQLVQEKKYVVSSSELNTQIDTTGLPPGTYIVKVINSKKKKIGSKRVIIQ